MLDEPEKTKIVVVKMLDDGSIKVALDVTLRDGPHSASGWIDVYKRQPTRSIMAPHGG